MKRTSTLIVALAVLLAAVVFVTASASRILLPGDLNGDGKVNSADARAVLRIAAKLDPQPAPVEVIDAAPATTDAPTTTEAPTTAKPAVPIVFDASKYNSNTQVDQIRKDFPYGTLSKLDLYLDGGPEVLIYQYENMAFAFIGKKLQTVFISFGIYEPYTDQAYDDIMDPLQLRSKDDFLPSFGLSGGAVEIDEDGYLLMHNCGCDTLVMIYDEAAVLGVEIAYTDAFIELQ